jgi:hypothetical protein
VPLDVAVAGGLNGTSVAARLRVARERVRAPGTPSASGTHRRRDPALAEVCRRCYARALARRYDLPISQVVNAAGPVRGVAARARWESGRGRRRPGSRYGSFQDRAHLDRAVVGAWDFGGRDPQERPRRPRAGA